jgi:L-threonylcarbamoyladenylate synthase
LVTAGLETLAIRVPNHPTAQRLLELANAPIAAPSANPSGRISPTTAQHVLDGLFGKIAAVLDDGACTVGLESTILGLAPDVALLRHGGVAVETIEKMLSVGLSQETPKTITAPGQMESHYAPNEVVRLNVSSAMSDELFLGFGPMQCDLNLSENADLIVAAANLFDHLHQLDKIGKPIAIAPIPQTGLGRAIKG